VYRAIVSDKLGDRRDEPWFLHATEPREKLVNVPLSLYFSS